VTYLRRWGAFGPPESYYSSDPSLADAAWHWLIYTRAWIPWRWPKPCSVHSVVCHDEQLESSFQIISPVVTKSPVSQTNSSQWSNTNTSTISYIPYAAPVRCRSTGSLRGAGSPDTVTQSHGKTVLILSGDVTLRRISPYMLSAVQIFCGLWYFFNSSEPGSSVRELDVCSSLLTKFSPFHQIMHQIQSNRDVNNLDPVQSNP